VLDDPGGIEDYCVPVVEVSPAEVERNSDWWAALDDVSTIPIVGIATRIGSAGTACSGEYFRQPSLDSTQVIPFLNRAGAACSYEKECDCTCRDYRKADEDFECAT
jgi:hypothetical protein